MFNIILVVGFLQVLSFLLSCFLFFTFCEVLRLNDFNHKLSSKMTLEVEGGGRLLHPMLLTKGNVERNLWKQGKTIWKSWNVDQLLGFEGGKFFLVSRFFHTALLVVKWFTLTAGSIVHFLLFAVVVGTFLVSKSITVCAGSEMLFWNCLKIPDASFLAIL